MAWELRKSRNLFYKAVRAKYGDRPWVEEVRLLQAAGFPTQSHSTLTEWDPVAPGAHSNCPDLDGTIRELKGLVGSQWEGRADAIYAGRARHGGTLAEAVTGPAGGAIVVGFDFSYSVMVAIALYFNYLDFLNHWREPIATSMGPEFRRMVLQQLEQVRMGGLFQLHESQLLTLNDESRVVWLGRLTQLAELWAVGHELAHHILRDGTSRPDLEARQVVDNVLASPDLQAELRGLPSAQVGEARADALSMLLLAGEFAGDTHVVNETQTALGALVALLAIGLRDDGWETRDGDTHPGVLVRMSLVAKLGSRRILARGEGTTESREAAVRPLSALVSMAGWLSGRAVSKEHHRGDALTSAADVLLLNTILMIPGDVAIFG